MTNAVGSDAPRADARAKVTGEARFVGDLEFPGLLHGRVLRSPVAHARIRSLDVTAAEKAEGVVAVLTRDDLRDLKNPYFGHTLRDRPIVADDRVRFVGEPIAAVVATSESLAEAALLAIDPDYEPLPVVANVDAALRPGAPLVHERFPPQGLFYMPQHAPELDPQLDGNVYFEYELKVGNLEEALASAHAKVEGEYRFSNVYQYAMETHTVVAHWTDEQLSVWTSCQHPFLVRAELAEVFERDVDSVRVHVPYVGGGFGSKSYTKMEPLAVALSRKGGAPVRLRNSVSESMATTRRHGGRCWMRTTADEHGQLLSREVRVELDSGAYADNGPRVASSAGSASQGAYRWQALDVSSKAIYTNTAPAGSYRGFGSAQTVWIGEVQVDEIGRRLGIDPVEMRRRNLVRRGERLKPGGTPMDADLVGDLEAVASALGIESRERVVDEGFGIAVGLGRGGADTVSRAVVRLSPQGRATVLTGTTEIGQGARTVLAQIAAEVLALDPGSIRVMETDTAYTPFDRSTGASRSTTISGLAVMRAAEHVRDQLFVHAQTVWQTDMPGFRLEGGAVVWQDQRLTYDELLRRSLRIAGATLEGVGSVGGLDEFPTKPAFHEVGIAGAHIRVDPETGEIRLKRVVTVADVGKAINPQLVERQDEGCALQAIGYTLFEEMLTDDDGTPLNDTLLGYRIPTVADVPDGMECIIIENGDGPGPFGAKGCGEGVFGGLPAAIVTALWDAGVPVTALPATPERVWELMNQQRVAQ